MTQEEKELLIKDLCARLPYGVMIQIPELFYPQRKIVEKLVSINDLWHFNDDGTYIENVKPYLRPMSSMTEEEHLQLVSLDGISTIFGLGDKFSVIKPSVFDWLNKRHFDYRGLIEKGIAIAVTKENNPYKE